MAYTAATVTTGGLPYQIVGAQRETITDFTITTYTASGEPVLNTDMGLNLVDSASAQIQSSTGGGGTAVAAAIIAGPKIKLNLATGADGAIGATNTVVRVTARGK